MISFLVLLAVNVSAEEPSIIPLPQSVELRSGRVSVASLRLAPSSGKIADPLRLYIMKDIKSLKPDAAKTKSVPVQLSLDPQMASLGSEGYRLCIEPDGVRIVSAGNAGLFYGYQSLKQMALKSEGQAVPCVQIEDNPRFTWRGLHIDVARRFMPIEFLYKIVDQLAMHKMNVLHLHLTDDQGWRIEIKRYPKLTSVGSKRSDSQTSDRPDTFEGKPHSGYYTQEQMRKLVAYASERFVTIMPEIEMPGHSQAAIAAYPELGNTGIQLEVATGWGVHVDILNVEDSTLSFYQNVLDEVMAIFPSKFIHIGGDEAPKQQWKESKAAQAKMKKLGLKDEDALQSWFIRQMDDYLTSKGRRLVGWDEIAEGGLAKGAVVMSWRDAWSAVTAAEDGHDAILADHRWAYFDQAQTNDPAKELKRSWGHLSIARVFDYDPVPKGLKPGSVKHILGAQAALWTEAILDSDTAEYQLFPRLCAMSEALWTGKKNRDYIGFYFRLTKHLPLLRAMKVKMHPLDPLSPRYVGFIEEVGNRPEEKTYGWDVSPYVGDAGDYTIELTYCGGNKALTIGKIELTEDGLTVASADHPVKIDPWNGEGRVELKLPKVSKDKKYRLQITTTVPKDTVVEVRIRRA